MESGAFSGLSNLDELYLNENVTLTDLNLEAADFSSLNRFDLAGNDNITSVSLRNAVVNPTSLDVLMNGTSVDPLHVGIGELGGITKMDLSGVDFANIDIVLGFSMMDDLSDLWLVDPQNLEALELMVLLDNLDTFADPNIEGILYLTQDDFDDFNTLTLGELAAWHDEDGHHVEFLQRGDMNHDNVVNNLDMERFMETLLNGPFDVAADMNRDGFVSGLDVAAFVTAVQGGSSARTVPEPATLWLTALALLGLVAYGRRRRKQST